MTSRIGSPDTPADIEVRECLSEKPPRSFIMKSGAGSGKTTSLVKALQHIEDTQGVVLRRAGQRVACITYTKVAVAEIWGDVGNSPLFHVSTIHSFLWSIIQPFQSEIRAWVAGRIVEKISEKQAHHARPRTQARTRERLEQEILRLEADREEIRRVRRFTYSTGSDYARGVLGHDDVLKLVPECIERLPLLRRLIAGSFPFVFVDESQDTSPLVVESLRRIAIERRGFCVGFFGDPMQKIFPGGAGVIVPEDGWRCIDKPENFRCPTSVLNLINAIREEGDGLEQIRGRMVESDGEARPLAGSAQLFVLPADEQRASRLRLVREWLRQRTDDGHWVSDSRDSDVRVLVLVHRTAAIRLGFPNIYSALHDNAPSELREGLDDGSAWPLRPFLSSILPIVMAEQVGDRFSVIAHLRAACPTFQRGELINTDAASQLSRLQVAVSELVRMFAQESTASLREVLVHIQSNNLISLDERYRAYLEGEPTGDRGPELVSISRLLDCGATELWGYKRYLDEESPFATQQGVKGAQFERVIVILDDEEGVNSHFSYGKYFGYVALSETDEERIAAGEESVLDRTRRLFYVCCSRAAKDLAVVLYASNVNDARGAIEAKGLFPVGEIYGAEDL